MGTIVISENVTLDGVIQDPTGDGGSAFGGWFDPATSPDREAWAKVELEEALAADALLLGRRTYDFLAARWTDRTGEWADRLNSLPKYVVSATFERPRWNNSTVLQGDVASEVAKLKDKVAGQIVVYASGRLVPTLMEHGLVDELRLMFHPFVAGAKERLFRATGTAMPLRLISVRTVGDGLALLTYQTVRAA